MKKILVHGWYNHDNLGDQLFQPALENLFPECKLTFTNHIYSLNEYDAVFIGGGSLLDGKPNFSPEALTQLDKAKIFYLGVGTETDFHPIHQKLMSKAGLIATRSKPNKRLTDLNKNVIYIPDLVYSLYQETKNNIKPKSVLIFPSFLVAPHNLDPQWKFAAWNYFKSEFSQFMDYLIENKYSINLAPLCTNYKINDAWAGMELTNQMVHRNNYNILLPDDLIQIILKIQEYSVIITQRYHGTILAQMARRPHITLCHHDKMKTDYFQEGQYLPYYGLTKRMLIDAIDNAQHQIITSPLPLDRGIFNNLKVQVLKQLSEPQAFEATKRS